MPSPILEKYVATFKEHEGFFLPMAMATWDFLFGAQRALGVTGGMLEIGVFKGKSAILAAMHMAPDELCFFLDLHETPVAKKAIESVRLDNNVFLKMDSQYALSEPRLLEIKGQLRWIHIDGEHTGYATHTDLETAAALLSPDGLICVDDFFSFKYPQLTAAVYSFLFKNPFGFRMIMASANKCYICRTAWAERYDTYIRESAIEEMQLEKNNWTLARTSFIHDFGCFSILPRNKDRNFVGLDRDMNARVF